MGSGKLLDKAKKKHGIENFKKEILFIFETEVEMNAKEAEIVTPEFCLREDTYNLCPGGHGGFGYINDSYELSQKRDIRENKIKGYNSSLNGYWIGKKRPPASTETKKKLSALAISQGTFHMQTEEARNKRKNTFAIKQHNKGENNSNFGKCWINNDIHCLSIPKEDLYFYLEKGYKKGRRYKKSY